jgi:hypothetical protein
MGNICKLITIIKKHLKILEHSVCPTSWEKILGITKRTQIDWIHKLAYAVAYYASTSFSQVVFMGIELDPLSYEASMVPVGTVYCSVTGASEFISPCRELNSNVRQAYTWESMPWLRTPVSKTIWWFSRLEDAVKQADWLAEIRALCFNKNFVWGPNFGTKAAICTGDNPRNASLSTSCSAKKKPCTHAP